MTAPVTAPVVAAAGFIGAVPALGAFVLALAAGGFYTGRHFDFTEARLEAAQELADRIKAELLEVYPEVEAPPSSSWLARSSSTAQWRPP